MLRQTELWCADSTYEKHRIPGMLVTCKGTLLAYKEARRTAEDWAMMDILLQRSTDRGETFSAPVALAFGTEQHPTVNNPVMMQDKNGRIHLLYCEDYAVNGGRVLRRYSDDDGVTWSEPRDITRFTAPKERTCFAFGPGHGICLSDGTLLVPVWLVPTFYNTPVRKHGPSVVTTFTSKDNGETFELGELLWTTREVVSPNETTAAELSDGSVYLNLRSQAGYRAHAFSKNGKDRWENYALDLELSDARCFGSAVSHTAKDGRHLLIFANCANAEARDHVTVHVSFDDGKTWSIHKLLDTERGGYVELACDTKNDLLYVLYEEDYGSKCHLTTCDLAWLLS